MIEAAIALAVILIGGIFILLVLAVFAPRGWQDESGFHYGDNTSSGATPDPSKRAGRVLGSLRGQGESAQSASPTSTDQTSFHANLNTSGEQQDHV